MKRLLLVFFLLITNIIVGCTKIPDSAPTTHQFDPKVPGGKIGGDKVIFPVEELNIFATAVGSIKLTWTVPSLYHTLPYKIMIYRKAGTTDFSLPDPASAYNSANLFKVKEISQSGCPDGNCSFWINGSGGDGPIVSEGITYRYWVYIFINENWSAGQEVSIKAAQSSVSLNVPDASNFWFKTRFSIGLKPNPPSTISPSGQTVSTFNSRQTEEACSLMSTVDSCRSLTGCEWDFLLNQCHRTSILGNPKGDIAFGFGGGIAFIADTDNNRVVVYLKELAIACEQYRDDEPIYQACLFTSQGGPYTTKNVLGQPDQYTNLPCMPGCQLFTSSNSCVSTSGCQWTQGLTSGSCSSIMPLDSCMTKPSGVLVSNGKVFVSDSGNNRVLIWDHMVADPARNDAGGCDPNISPINPKDPDCKPRFQIGKKSLTDFNNYNLSVDGAKILNNPTGLAEKDGDLFIADTGNHRIVKVKQFADKNVFSCDEDNWDTSFCKFSAVLGQPGFEVSRTFNDFINEDNVKKAACSELSNPRPGNAVPAGSETACVSSPVGCGWAPLITTGQGICSYQNPILDSSDIGSLLAPAHENLLKRYFANPTTIKITPDNKLLVLSNENYSRQSVVGNPIQLKSRVLIFNSNPLSGEPPLCELGTFSTGACDADDVIGQLEFRRLITMQNSSSKYSDVIFGLEDMSDFDVSGSNMIGVDTKNNFVYIWKDWTDNSIPGHAPTSRAVNPLGQKNPNSTIDLPDLLGITSVEINEDTSLIYVNDPYNHKIYEIQGY